MSITLIGSMEKFADFVNEGINQLDSTKYKKNFEEHAQLAKKLEEINHKEKLETIKMGWQDFRLTQDQTITLDRLHKMAINNEKAVDEIRGLLKSDTADDIIESLKKINDINKIMNLMHIEKCLKIQVRANVWIQ